MKKNILTKIYFVLLAFLLIGVGACNKQHSIDTSTIVEDELLDKTFKLNNNSTELNKRIKIVGEPVMFTGNFKVPIPNDDCGSYTWYLIADVEAPLYNGEPLSATDVRILGNKAYVSYHRQGDVYAGGLEVIDISDPANPSIISYMEFDGVDINTLAVNDIDPENQRKIFLAGSSFKKGAVLRQVISNNGYLDGSILDVSLSNAMSNGTITPSANGIGLSSNYIFMTAGNNAGGTFQLDRNSLAFLANEEYKDAKAIGLNGVTNGSYQVSLVAGDNAKLFVHRVGTDRSLVNTIPLGTIIHQKVAEPYLGKATVSMLPGDNIAYIATNSTGMKGVNVETGNVVYTSPANMLTKGNTHGLTVDGRIIYLANSDDGLFIGCLPLGGGEISMLQHWDLDEKGASANMVQTYGDWVFVAKGGGGLKILRKIPNSVLASVCSWDANGRPLCIKNPETLCETLVADFKADLPEFQNALVNRPNYFLNENREILLTQQADISVTFVSEGAGNKNTFGYYTYNKNNPPTTAAELRASMKIIFANASALNSGGTLVEGDRVYLGTFEPGTVIGYFLISNGWNGFGVTDGLYTFYTIPQFNRNGTQQSLMMYSESCSSLLTTFEDIHTAGGDKDFNDIVVKTTITPMTAMNMSNVLKLPNTN